MSEAVSGRPGTENAAAASRDAFARWVDNAPDGRAFGQVIGHVFAPDAACLGVIRLPETAANFCFGDDDLRSLYVTASTSLYRVRVATPGTAQWQC